MPHDQPDPSTRGARSRRSLLTLGALASWAAPAAAQLRQPTPRRPVRPADAELLLARRITFGATADDVAQARGFGFSTYLDWQLNPAGIDDAACQARLAAYPALEQPPMLLYQQDSATVQRQLIEATITRAIYSRRQLYERMVDFWSDHFHTSISTAGIHKLSEHRDVMRVHALGTFRDLLNGSAASPAMLIYLNTAQSTRQAPNQNYARELMELHTLGVDGGYSQQDVVAVARCFTGWRYHGNTGDTRAGTFYFDAGRHDTGAKTVLGVTIPAGGGTSDGQTVLRILAEHPSTARFVSRKLIRWLLRYDPQPSLVQDIANTFLQTGGNVRELIRRILTVEQVQVAPSLFKRPQHYVASVLRALSIDSSRIDVLRNSYINPMGHGPFAWGPPNGYPQAFEYWAELPLPRWNFAALVANGSVAGSVPDISLLLGGATTAAQIADRIEQVVFAGMMPPGDKAALLTYIGPSPVSTARAREAFGLALASPGFQWF